MPGENELLEWNVKVIERHDRDIHKLQLDINGISADLKVIKTLAYIMTGSIGLVGTIASIIKVFG